MKSFLLTIVFLFSHGVFAEDSCGKLLNALLKFDPQTNKATFDQFFFTSEDFCDHGIKELNANVDIQFFDKNQKIIYEKSVFINTYGIAELLNKKEMNFAKNQMIKAPQYRNVKFSLKGAPETIVNYKIISKADQKVWGEGAVK